MRKVHVVLCALLVLNSGAAEAARCVRAPSLEIVAEVDSNANSATAVDLVLIANRATLPLLAGLTAADYFAQKNALQAELANGIQVMSLQIPPATVIAPPRMRGCFVGAILFANYLSPGAHRLALGDAPSGVLRLGRDDIAWSAGSR